MKAVGEPPAAIPPAGRGLTEERFGKKRRFAIDEKRWVIPLPGFILLAIATLPPFFYALYLSVFNFDNQATVATRFVGLQNYVTVLTSGRSLHAFGETIVISIESTIFAMVFGLFIAMLIAEHAGKLAQWILILFLLPMIISPVVAALNFSLLLNSLYGPIDQVIYGFVHTVIAWTDTAVMATEVIVAVQVWQWTPFAILIFYSGLKSLPTEPVEAAKLDGANRFALFWNVTFPLLRNVIIVTGIFEFLLASLQFTPTQLLTSGGPGNATESVALYIYRVGVAETGSVSLAAAAGVVALAITIVIATIWVNVTRSSDTFGAEAAGAD